MASQPLYQFHAELCDYKPTVWRKFQVSGGITVARLGYILMTLFEMRACHLFSIEMPRDESSADAEVVRYELPNEHAEPFFEPDVEVFDAALYKLSRVLTQPGERLLMNYDFGDDWWINLSLAEVILNADLPSQELPRVLDGAGYGIIEDCGGVWGLEELAQVMKSKKGERYEELSEWLGVDELDLNAFDRDDMNFRLKKIPRIYAQCYEQRKYPTKRSIDLIERKYLRDSNSHNEG